MSASTETSRDVMQINLTCGQIREYADGYDYPKDPDDVYNAMLEAQDRGYVAKADLVLVDKWLTGRHTSLLEDNDEEAVKQASAAAFSQQPDARAIMELRSLYGVGWTTASAILHFAFPDKYPIMSTPVMCVVTDSEWENHDYNITVWEEYIGWCQKKSNECCIDLRTLDKALWAYAHKQRLQQQDVKLKTVALEDFRGIRKISISFDTELTVIIGRNGAGKTSILDAIVELLKPVREVLINPDWKGEKNTIRLIDHDIHKKASSCHLSLSFNSLASGDGGYSTISKMRQGEDNASLGGGKSSREWRVPYSIRYAQGQVLFVYYKQDRGFDDGAAMKDIHDIDALHRSSLSGGFSAINDLDEWWDEKDAREARTVRDRDMNHRDPELETIRELIKKIDSFEEIHYSSMEQPSGLYFEKSDGDKVHVGHLSSGERSFIILLADLARRLQAIAPGKALEDIPGIVLIDEIELNLHPAWQAEIIPTLRKVFKSCQFVITTHSPKVLSEVNNINVRALNWDEKEGERIVKIPLNTRGRSSNYLLEGVFGESDRSKEVGDMMKQFNRAIDDKKVDKAKKLLKKLRKIIEGDPVELLVFRKRLRSLEEEHEGQS